MAVAGRIQDKTRWTKALDKAVTFDSPHDSEMQTRQRMDAEIPLAIDAKDIGQSNAGSFRCWRVTGGRHGLAIYNCSLSRRLPAESTFCGRSLKYRWVERMEV
jgi:hypothetical protein